MYNIQSVQYVLEPLMRRENKIIKTTSNKLNV